MTAAAERRRSIPVSNVVDHIRVRLAEWDVPDADVLWAIQKGAPFANSKRSKRLMAAAQYGGSRLVPYDDVWVVKGSQVILEALEILEAELIGKVPAAAAAQPPKLHPLVDRSLTVPRHWVAHRPDGSIRHFQMGRTVSPVVTAGMLMQYRNVDRKMYAVRYALAPVTPVADGSHFWLTEIAVDPYDREL